ncbi:MAG: carboxylating nicotinate-nucleotide diphosphorylase [Crocinitomicaceae bacterium]|jgi:nicotinate-nucleotide pyrophosphorylase (carboxylating)|nr:carboxylating nicotinate-nucleotide diphosphorylase [Crocinitomicaceae bacterium]
MIDEIIDIAIREDIGEGDHTAMACIPPTATGTAALLVKEDGVLAGVELAKRIIKKYDRSLVFHALILDGAKVKKGDIAFTIAGNSRAILSIERLVLNFMQRMSGIATQTNQIVTLLEGTKAQVLDTRKTTPGIRAIEKWAVAIGGGVNHRFGLYDMILIKDNHIDYAGGIAEAIRSTQAYLKTHQKRLKIEIEVRDEKELQEVLDIGGVDRIMLDNFTPEAIKKVLPLIPSQYETEASGGITIENIRSYAETGVDFISSGALTHSVKAMDLSLKAKFN